MQRAELPTELDGLAAKRRELSLVFTLLFTRRRTRDAGRQLLGAALGVRSFTFPPLSNCCDSGGDTVEDEPLVIHRSLFRPGSFPASG
jgi:hypothetical protein